MFLQVFKLGISSMAPLEARSLLCEEHHMSNIYFMVFMIVISYFYMTFSQFIGYLS